MLMAPIVGEYGRYSFMTRLYLIHHPFDSYSVYIWPCFLIWGIDRLCRYIRYLILSNFHAPNKKPAHVELVTPDTIRITVRRQIYGFQIPLSPFEGGWTPGQHMYLAFPTIGPIESHPFTIANIAEPLTLTTEKGTKANEFELVWVVRARDGFTRRLKEQILTKNKHKISMGVTDVPLTCELPIFMDGPYGAPPDITRFETCVFMAGEYSSK
jgi:ferric-chelate reductase